MRPRPRVAHDAEEAIAAARDLGYPVVLKLVSATISHKSDVGGVVLDLRNDDDVRNAYVRVRERLAAGGLLARMEGVLIQPMLLEGLEAIVGMSHDPSFGPLIMFGLGGINVELLRDVAFRVHPLTDRDARELERSVRGFPLLGGWRGGPPGDVAALEEMLLRVSQLAGDHPELLEMDLNPVRVLSPGRGCLVVDARVATRVAPPRPRRCSGCSPRAEPRAGRRGTRRSRRRSPPTPIGWPCVQRPREFVPPSDPRLALFPAGLRRHGRVVALDAQFPLGLVREQRVLLAGVRVVARDAAHRGEVHPRLAIESIDEPGRSFVGSLAVDF